MDQLIYKVIFNVVPKHKHKELEFIEKEKDLGVNLNNNLKFSSHITNQIIKANHCMRLIERSYTYLDKISFRYLFNALIRPHLEYCVVIWYPLVKKDNELTENVLCRASKLIPGYRSFHMLILFVLSISQASP